MSFSLLTGRGGAVALAGAGPAIAAQERTGDSAPAADMEVSLFAASR